MQRSVSLFSFLAVILSAQVTAQFLSQSQPLSMLGRTAEQVESVEQHAVTFPTLGVTVTMVKAVDKVTGEVQSVAVDSQGRAVDVSALRRQEILARQSVPAAKLQVDLAAKVQASVPGEVIPVVAWLHFNSEVLDAYAAQRLADIAHMSVQDEHAAEADIAQFVIARNAEVTAPFVAAARAEGLASTFVSTTAPAVFFELTATEILGLAGMPQVDTVYIQRNDRTDGNNNANKTHRTDRVHSYGVRGTFTTVAMLEDNGLDPACPHLNIAGWFNPGNPDPDNHIHGTSGCVASQLSSRLGSSPDVSLLSANATTYSDANVTAAADWIQASTSTDVTNMSFGGNYSGAVQYLDRYFDYQSRQFRDSYVAAAGNSNLTGYVNSPGTSWNCITVGSFNDVDNGNWTGDTMSSFSSALNPTNGCEKPNLAAVGHDVDTLGDASNGWLTDNYSGTSFAAPHVAGNLANLADASAAGNIPESAMANLMATAWHNIEGSSRLSGEDGAGGLHGLAAFRARNQQAGQTVTPANFSNNGYFTYTINLKGGDRARVCIAWGANANAGYTSTLLDADLDLAVYAGTNQTSGTSYGSSLSFNNNFEIVEFTPPTTGAYTVRVNDYRFDGTSEYLAIAWSQKTADTAYGRIRESSGSETAPTLGPTLGNPSYGMHLYCPGSPSGTYIVYPSGTMVSGLPISSQTWFPLDLDIWTSLWQDHLTTGAWFWNNTSGALNSSGTSLSFSMSLPAWAFLPGFELYHVGATIEAGYPDLIKEITETHRFHFWPLGTEKTKSDDGSFTQALPFGFTFYGVNYTQCFVNMNGNITFGGPDSDYTESAAELLAGLPRIAACWDDLEPNQDGNQGPAIIRVRQIYQGAQRVIIEFINCGEYLAAAGSTGSNTFRYTLADDNSITVEYFDMTLNDCIVGVSPGGGLSSSTEVNLSSYGFRSLVGGNSALFEQFTGTGGDDLDLGSANNIFLPTYWKKIKYVPTTGFFGGVGYRAELDL